MDFVERQILEVIYECFGLHIWDVPAIVKRADDTMLATEWRDLMPESDLGWFYNIPTRNEIIRPWLWQKAEFVLLNMFNRVRAEI
jgi:hypothetical protein